MKRYLLMAAWAITRGMFIVLWGMAEPVGELNVWLKEQWLHA